MVAWPQGRPARVDDQASAAPLVAKIAECLQRKEWNGFIKFADTKQDKYLAAYAPIPGTTWLVINTIPESRLTAEVQSVRNKMLLIGFLGLLFSIAMAAIISRSISAPLKELMGKMRASGNLVNQTPAEQGSSYPVDMKGQDELSRLAYSFAGLSDAVNQKIHEINDINASLENKVRERTTALAASEQESRTLIENSPDTIARYDLQCRRIYVNPVFGKLTEGGIAALLWKTPSESPGGPNAEIYEAKIKEVIASGENGQFELKWPGKDGKEHCSHIRLTAERDESGRVISILGVGRDITALNHSRSELAEVNAQLESMNARLQSLATSDPLTLLPNRRLLLDRLHKALASGARHARSGAIMFIDLDNFKTLNDTLGHDVGDILLQQVAKRLESCVRETDTVARLGGDEFVVMLEDLSGQVIEAAEQTELVGNKILAMFNQPYQLATHEYQNTASIGATLFNDNLQTPDELMKQADIAMYQAKKAGRNTLRFFDPRMQEVVNAHAALENELRKALENRQFHLYYQIQVGELQADGTHRPLGAEALIRWIHPERGVISPAQFIPLAEETGTILLIGQWVLDTACAQLKAWQQDALTRDLVLAVNVSAKQFLQPNFKDQVQAVVQRHAINPRRLKLELTESLFLDNIDNVIVTMNALNEIGILFSLDDFGTGYSSLQYLKRLPLDQLKIDQSFVRDIVSDSSDRAIISTIIAMANSLNLNVIAEGVETAEQLELLLSKGCVHYQGYLFGKPMPIEHFNADTRFVTSS